jgi:hypothetical protein
MRARASEEDRDEGTAAWGLVAGIMRAIEQYNAEVGLESPEAGPESPEAGPESPEAGPESPAGGKAGAKAPRRRKVEGPDRAGA